VNGIARGTNWLVMAFAIATAIVRQASRPVTWRRSVRNEFWRFMELVCVRNLAAVLIAAALVGLTLVSQGLYWLDKFGQADAVGQVIIFVMVREIGPLIVGFLVLGSGGIVLLVELAAMRAGGHLDALDRQGIDPFVLLVVPRVIAVIVAVFSHTILFIVVSLATGFVMAKAVGAIAMPLSAFLYQMLTTIGTTGYIVLPVKTVAIGITIGTLCSLSALAADEGRLGSQTIAASGFIRAVSGVLLVNAVLSLAL
jgi:phospholipid/cholesterol/gamma-HCH transport system permease protein